MTPKLKYESYVIREPSGHIFGNYDTEEEAIKNAQIMANNTLLPHEVVKCMETFVTVRKVEYTGIYPRPSSRKEIIEYKLAKIKREIAELQKQSDRLARIMEEEE